MLALLCFPKLMLNSGDLCIIREFPATCGMAEKCINITDNVAMTIMSHSKHDRNFQQENTADYYQTVKIVRPIFCRHTT